MNGLKMEENRLLCINFEKRQRIEMKGNLTLPKVILQIVSKGGTPPQELIAEALQSIENIADQLRSQS